MALPVLGIEVFPQTGMTWVVMCDFQLKSGYFITLNLGKQNVDPTSKVLLEIWHCAEDLLKLMHVAVFIGDCSQVHEVSSGDKICVIMQLFPQLSAERLNHQ